MIDLATFDGLSYPALAEIYLLVKTSPVLCPSCPSLQAAPLEAVLSMTLSSLSPRNSTVGTGDDNIGRELLLL